EDGVVARVIGVVHRRPVARRVGRADAEVLGDRDRFGMRDEKALLRARARHPAANARARPGALKVDRGPTALLVAKAVVGEATLVTAPAELARLQRFVDERIDRPG